MCGVHVGRSAQDSQSAYDEFGCLQDTVDLTFMLTFTMSISSNGEAVIGTVRSILTLHFLFLFAMIS